MSRAVGLSKKTEEGGIMDFSVSSDLSEERVGFRRFLDSRVEPNLSVWYRNGSIPKDFFSAMGRQGWLGFKIEDGMLEKTQPLRGAIVLEEIAIRSPGVAVAVLAQVDLGLTGLWLFGSQTIKQKYAESAGNGDILICLGNTESGAGSDVANISMKAKPVEGGWVLNGTKAYVTNGSISDLAIVTAVSTPRAPRNNRLSMFLVDLAGKGVKRTKLDKRGWIPSDLTRVQLTDVFVPGDHLMGDPGRGLQQVLTVFTHSRVPIAALTLGTAVGAFEAAIEHAKSRKVFGKRIVDFQAKAFEIADFYARMEAARLMLWKACWAMDQGLDFRLESSMAKYLAVSIAKEVTPWAADLFGAASMIVDHPIHKFPMDAWASSLGEGTQDIQKLVIFREVMRRYGG
jgi:alkylation response protein AidB-like acyl-CoA dehydrogenase